MKSRLSIVLALTVTFLAPGAWANVIYVDQDAVGAGDGTSWADAFNSVQPAVDAAVAGDEIRVAEGVYIRTVPTDTTVVTMKDGVSVYGGYAGFGEPDPDERNVVAYPTVLNGQNVCTHVVVAANNVTLDGFTVTGGNASGTTGGGMLVDHVNKVVVRNCTFDANTAQRGGGMYSYSVPSLLVENCRFTANVGTTSGGGMGNRTDVWPQDLQILNCVFLNNQGTSGGGMHNVDAEVFIADTLFDGNTASSGGAILNETAFAEVIRTEFRNNSVTVDGGAVFNYDQSPVFTNCLFWNNHANIDGGAMANLGGTASVSPVLRHCSFNGNTADGSGGAMHTSRMGAAPAPAPTVTSCIFWGDTSGGAPSEIVDVAGVWTTATYSDIQGGFPGLGNIGGAAADDPSFVNAAGGDLHLLPGSPCIDLATNAGAPTDDLDRERRPQGGRPDMGAYEAPGATIWYVDADMPVSGLGTSWAEAFKTVQEGMAAAAAGDEIRVAEGVYYRALPADRVVLTMTDGVGVFGGFAGLGAPDPDVRDPGTFVTVLDGEGFCYHVVWGADNATLDGFTITGGNANGASPDESGAGMYIDTKQFVTVEACRFFGNVAAGNGGGMYNVGAGPLTVRNCTFEQNTSGSSGGGMFSAGEVTPGQISDTTFVDNQANMGGGLAGQALYSPLDRCVFKGNIAAAEGGGIYDRGMQNQVTNCLFFRNQAGANGGAISSYSLFDFVDTHLLNCTFSENFAGVSGGGMYTSKGMAAPDPVVLVTNSIFWNDISPGLPEIEDVGGMWTTVNFSDVEFGWLGPGVSNINANPMFVDQAAGDLHLQALSPCIDQADGALDPETDLDSNPRTDGDGNGSAEPDMGAFEFQAETEPAISIDDVAMAEGNAGQTAFVFTVSLSAPSGQVVTVDWATANGTATSGEDYTAANGTLTFTPGQTSQTVTVQVSGDTKFEPDETFTVDLTNPVNGTMADEQGVGTIGNDDSQPAVSIDDVAMAEGNAGQTAFVFTVSLSNPSYQTVTVDWAAADGTATSGEDYTAASGTVTFNPTVTSQTVTVQVLGDVKFEPNETFTVDLSNPSNATIADNQGLGTINNDDVQPDISIDDVTLAEGDAGQTAFVFTVSLSNPSYQTVTVDWAAADVTASAGEDYTAVSGTVTFNPTVTSQTVTVQVLGDYKYEPNETFTVDLSNPSNASIADNQGLGTINNDDSQPAIDINNVIQFEGNAGQTPLVFTVSLSNPSYQPVTVNWATANGTATAGEDYTAASGTVTFNPSEMFKTVTVQVTGDNKYEIDETFTVDLTNPTNATIADDQGLGTINNDDLQPTISIDDVTVAEGNAGQTPFVFTVSLSNPSYQTVTVDWAAADGTATSGEDYTAVSGTVTFNPTVTSQTVTVQVTGDDKYEPDETFTVNLSNPANATITDSQGVGIINNDDSQPAVSIDDVTLAEGNAGQTAFVFTVSLSNPGYQTITVDWTTANGTATSGEDYTAAGGTVTFNPTETSKTVTVQVTGDAKFEPNETFTVNLSNPTNATIADNQGLGTINNDDIEPTISIDDVTLTEGNAGQTPFVFTVSLSNPSYQTVTVNWAAADGTATSGEDYTAAGGTVTFNPTVTSQTVTVQVTGDVKFEPNETFTVDLSNPSNATIADNQGLGTINNDDAQPTISINDVAQVEGNAGQSGFVFTVSLSNPSYQPVTVNWATANGTATSGEDYIAAGGTVTFNPADTSQTVTVQVTGDDKYELDETFTVDLTNPANATIADAQGLGTINNDDSQPTISINDRTVAEGNAGQTPFVFTVSLSNPSYQTITVDWVAADGTATAGEDYTAVGGTVTFNPTVTSQTVTVQVTGDTKFEPNETFTVNLSNPANATITDSQGLGIIQNDDSQPAISIGDVTLAEGNAGQTAFVFTVSLSNPGYQTITVDWATANGTATAGEDYTAAGGTVTFNPTETSKTVTVQVTGDDKYEPNETFTVNLSNPANATIADNQGLGTINNDDSQPGISIDDVTLSEGNAGQTPFVFTVSLSNPSSQTVTVNWATANGTGTAGEDFVGASGTVTFNPTETSKTVTVQVTGDTKYEANETFTVNLNSPTNATIADSQGLGTINNDDTQPTISIGDVTAAEGNAGQTPFVFTVSLSNSSYQTITVNWAAASGTATAGEDFVGASGTVTFNPTEISKTVTVQVTGDTKYEPNETFTVDLTNPTNATITDAQGLGTINNDDVEPTISINDLSLAEGNAGQTAFVFTVSLSNPSSQAITVDWATADDTATAGEDYTAAGGTVTFNPTEVSKTVTVQVTGDTKYEPNESFSVNLTNPSNATIVDAQGLGTINNDDSQPAVSIDDVTLAEGNAGQTAFVFTVSLSNPSYQTVTVNWATAGGTATAGEDFVAASGTVTFNPTEVSQTVTVQVLGDNKYEANEWFAVDLTNPTNATIGDAQGLGTINNDDAEPAISIDDVTLAEGNAGQTPFVFTVTLSNPSALTVTVNWAAVNGTANSGEDFVAANGTVTFNPTETSKTVTVQVTGDVKYEPDETFTVDLSNPVNATLADAQGLGTINNDDTQPTISINDVSLAEGNAGQTAFVFTVTLTNPSAQTITVDWAAVNGTATSGEDFVAANGTVTFNPTEVSKTITVQVTGDTKYEIDETFTVDLTNPTNATIADNQGLGTIINEDFVPQLSIADVTLAEGNTGQTDFVFTLSLSNASYQTISIDYTTTDGTALAAEDYTAVSGTETFTPGEVTRTVTVPVNGDTKYEPDESFNVMLSNPVNVIVGDSRGIGLITNDDSVPTISIDDVTEYEGLTGTTDFAFTLTLSNTSAQVITVDYQTSDGTAMASVDYTAAMGTATFNPGDATQLLTVLVTADATQEEDENFFVNLSQPVNVSIADAQGVGMILNDDGPPAATIHDATRLEGDSGVSDMVFRVTLSHPTIETVTLSFATADGSAEAGQDYTSASGDVTFQPGEMERTVAVQITGDATREPDEDFTVTLSNPVNATIADGQAVGVIVNDDGVPTLSIDDVSVTEGNTGTADLVFTVTLSHPTTETVTVDYATSDATAVAGEDYTAASGTLTFAPGVLTQTVTVEVLGDDIRETDETFNVDLSNAALAVIADDRGVGTIIDDDGPPSISIDDVTLEETNAGSVAFVFTVTLSHATMETVSVDFATVDGTAFADEDYTPVNGTLDFAPGELAKTVTVEVLGDTRVELDETFSVVLSNPVNATLADDEGVGTILNDDEGGAGKSGCSCAATGSAGAAGNGLVLFVVLLGLLGWRRRRRGRERRRRQQR